MKKAPFAIVLLLLILLGSSLLAIVAAGPPDTKTNTKTSPVPQPDDEIRQGDQELAYLLVKLELKTRGIIGGHYARAQSSFPGIDVLYKRWLTKNLILPAAVADGIFAQVVPQATSGRAWVKMVVDEPRNPNNRADDQAREMLAEIKAGSPFAERHTEEAYYYGEPIRTTALCLRCHGEPAGESDPYFPQYVKDGWKADPVVGAVIARVAPIGK